MEQLVARRAHNPKVIGSSPIPATIYGGLSSICESSSVVELYLAKVVVAGSSPVSRSKIRRYSQVVRQRSAKPRLPSSNLGAASKTRASCPQGIIPKNLQEIAGFFIYETFSGNFQAFILYFA